MNMICESDAANELPVVVSYSESSMSSLSNGTSSKKRGRLHCSGDCGPQPLLEFERGALGFASIMRDPSPQSRHRPIEAAQRRFDASGYADFGQLQLAAHVGALDEAHTIAAQARFGPAGDDHDQMGFPAYWTGGLFSSIFPEFRRDPRFAKLCARLGLVDYWLTTQHWPDCVDEVAPHYDFKAECAKVAAGE